jgi:hypothetical protein
MCRVARREIVYGHEFDCVTSSTECGRRSLLRPCSPSSADDDILTVC